jgi:hypothetical protein
MTLDDIKAHLRSAGVIPICVSNEPPNDGDRLTIIGGLPEYVEAVLAVGAKVVVVYFQTFVEDYFLHDPDDEHRESDENEEVDEDLIDLRVANKELRRFKEYVDQTALIRLSFQMQSDYLDLVIEEPWWREFLELRSRITDELNDARKQRIAAEEAREEAEVDGLIAQLHKLADDARFAKLPTQKSMLQYALRQIPELDSIDPGALKSEIQEMKAKIDAGP